MANGDFRPLAERQYTCYHVEPMLLRQQSPPRLVCLGEAVIFLANVAESLCDSPSLLDQRRSFSLVLTSRGATRLQKLTALERRTFVPKMSDITWASLSETRNNRDIIAVSVSERL